VFLIVHTVHCVQRVLLLYLDTTTRRCDYTCLSNMFYSEMDLFEIERQCKHHGDGPIHFQTCHGIIVAIRLRLSWASACSARASLPSDACMRFPGVAELEVPGVQCNNLLAHDSTRLLVTCVARQSTIGPPAGILSLPWRVRLSRPPDSAVLQDSS
jgi:hypothetical protein